MGVVLPFQKTVLQVLLLILHSPHDGECRCNGVVGFQQALLCILPLCLSCMDETLSSEDRNPFFF